MLEELSNNNSKELFEKFLENPAGKIKIDDISENYNGVPLGGIGTGKIEITPDGVLRNFTINNNYVFPISKMKGTFLAISVNEKGNKKTKLLFSDPNFFELEETSLLLKEEEIKYEGLWPKCTITYTPHDVPVRVTLTAFSPIIPNSMETNCLPITYFLFDVQNISSDSIEVSLHFSWEDLNGCWGSKVSWDEWVPRTMPHYSSDRGYINIHELSELVGVSFHHRDEHPEVANFAWGDYTLATRKDNGKVTIYQYSPDNYQEVLNRLGREGELPNSITNNNGEYAAVLSVNFSLPQQEKKQVWYALGWYTPERWGFGDGSISDRVATPFDYSGKKIGHWYANFYASSLEVVRKHILRGEEYLRKIEEWQAYILSSTLPSWLKEMLINNNYILSTNFYWAKDGRFSIMESPNCPCIGTLDQRFYGSPSTMIFVPSLDHRELMEYVSYSDKLYQATGKNKGQIYHDFGNNRLDSFNTYGYNWIDLNPKFVLLCWRNYLYSGNLDNLKDLFPKMKEAMEREEELDIDGDGLPEGYGNCNTYEKGFFGANSYDGGLWLAALKVFPEIARLMKDEKLASKYEKLFEKASHSFETKLWNDLKKHYIKCTEKKTPDPNDQCRDDQLTGQWYAHFLNKGYIHPPERVKNAICSIIDILKREISDDGSFIIAEKEIKNGSLVESNWPGYSVAHFAAEAVYEGFIYEALGAVKGVWEMVYNRYKLQWNQPLGLDVKRPLRGDRYMNSGSIWHFLWALQGFWMNVRDGIIKISPNIPKEWKDGFITPLVTTTLWGTIEWKETDDGKKTFVYLKLSLNDEFELNKLIVKASGNKKLESINIEGYRIEKERIEIERDLNGSILIIIKDGINITKGQPLEISYVLSE